MTYEQWRQQAAKRGDLNTESAWNAAIAARDEELRKQKPYAFTTGGDCREDGSIDCMAWTKGEFTKPLYAAPIPPEGDREKQHAHSMNQFKEVCKGTNCTASKAMPHHSPECKAEHEACYTAPIPTPSQQEAQWQPIETAPKDGSRLLLAFNNPDADAVWTGLWANAWMVSYGKAESEPTHWMPLPAPPKPIKEVTNA